jgi:hypothetical protein
MKCAYRGVEPADHCQRAQRWFEPIFDRRGLRLMLGPAPSMTVGAEFTPLKPLS